MKKTLVFALVGMFAIGAIACKPKADSAAAPAAKATDSAGSSIVAEYQKFADDYLAAYKKMKAGDMSAMKDFQSLGERAQEWAKKVQDQAATLTPEQQQKLKEIAENLAKAIQQ